MPVCNGCGGSYEDSHKFCPNCGRANPVGSNPIGSYVKCPDCGQANEKSNQFCQHCGKSIVQRCRQCGEKNQLTVSFCGRCGIKLSDAKFTLSEEFIDRLNTAFSEHPGCIENYQPESLMRTRYLPVIKSIDQALTWPYPVTYGQDTRIILVPIHEYPWAVKSANFMDMEITQGAFLLDRNSLQLYNFNRKSRILFLFDELLAVKHEQNRLVITFSKSPALQLNFNVPKASKATVNVVNVLGFLGGMLGEAISDDSNIERELKGLREDVRRADPNYISNSQRVDYQYHQEQEAIETFVPMFKYYFEEIIKEKTKLGFH